MTIVAVKEWQNENSLTLRLFVSAVCPFSARGVSYLFDIQVKTFDSVYDGEDVIAQARTGTGKTFSFAIPLVEKLQRDSAELARGRAPKVQADAQFHSPKNRFLVSAS